MIKLGQMVLKGVKWAHNDKIRSNGPERSQLGTHYHKNFDFDQFLTMVLGPKMKF